MGDDHPERLGGGKGPFGGEGSSGLSRGGEGAEGALCDSASDGHDGLRSLLLKNCSAAGGMNNECDSQMGRARHWWSGH